MSILLLQGRESLSSFRLGKIISKGKKEYKLKESKLKTEYWYFVHLNGTLTEKNKDRISQLLDAEIQVKSNFFDKENSFLVIPRLGTISPWSSKATDIINNCSISEVLRVERGMLVTISEKVEHDSLLRWSELFYDRMTESVIFQSENMEQIFSQTEQQTFTSIDLLNFGIEVLKQYNFEMGLALSEEEMDYLFKFYQEKKRNPTDVELMMFAQANSEHCRHKIFNADFVINDEKMEKSLFSMIKETHQNNPKGTIIAYKDNSSVIEGGVVNRFYPKNELNQKFCYQKENTHILMKVETHNHPTAISPFAGAATGAGGEIRDEGATGRGSKPKAGLTGFSVSNLNIPNYVRPWEFISLNSYRKYGTPERIASSLEIMIQGPIGSAAFNNEFGRPNILGYFRTFQEDFNGQMWGYHKPIMLAGGLGNIQAEQTEKKAIPEGALLIQLGGPGFKIGLGGGAASSMATGTNEISLDFDSVQRGNPEIERRAQEVIDSCWQLGSDNPILAIHDVGAGGLSNAFPELVNDAEKGAIFKLRKILTEENMSPKEIWCNESQERYVLSILEHNLSLFKKICDREKCPFSVIGTATKERILRVEDSIFSNAPVDMPLDILLGKPPKSLLIDQDLIPDKKLFEVNSIEIKEALYRVLQLPTVASKSFLITIGDRTVGGFTARDQMVGPYQTPVSDCAVTAMSYDAYLGEAMSIGERTPIAVIDSPASARIAIGEAITNIAPNLIEEMSSIKLSANWMAACGVPGEDARLYRTVQAASELCQNLNLSIPVGKDSLSMKTVWQDKKQKKSVISPVSLIVSAFSSVKDIRKSITPELKDIEDSSLILIDLTHFQSRLGASALALVYKEINGLIPDVEDPQTIKFSFDLIQDLISKDKLIAYHDRSDGGLIVSLAEMAFASHLGLNIQIKELIDQTVKKDKVANLRSAIIRSLFNEELGMVLQVKNKDIQYIKEKIAGTVVENALVILGTISTSNRLMISYSKEIILNESREELQQAWSETSFAIQSIRDNPICAESEFSLIKNDEKSKLFAQFNSETDRTNKPLPYINTAKPKVAVLREQGINGQLEMAAAFERAGFEVFDVHMTDLIEKRVLLSEFQLLTACGGFSYGDVLGAGRGWANSILYNESLRKSFSDFFADSNTLSLGVCNGCQMLSELADIIPGTEDWPKFKRNLSEQYEARLIMVKINPSSSILLKNMVGQSLPLVVSHGEGRVDFSHLIHYNPPQSLEIPLQYVDGLNEITMNYPLNPNGSPDGIAGVSSADGRVTIMMPHPERVFRNVQLSWKPSEWKDENSPWLEMFLTARDYFT